MLNMIFFNKETFEYHQQILKLTVEHCHQLQTYYPLQEINQVVGNNRSVKELILSLEEHLKLFINTGSIADAIKQLSVNRQKTFKHGLQIHQVQSMTICNYLAQIICQQHPKSQQIAPHIISQIRGYFLLLAATLAYNAACQELEDNSHDIALNLVVSCLKWLEDLELNHLGSLNHPVVLALRKQLVSQIPPLQSAISHARGTISLSPDDLQQQVIRKNQRSKEYALPFHGEVIFAKEVSHSYLPDPAAMQLLFALLQSMVKNGTSQRQQIFFYYNVAYGHVELLDVAFDATTQMLKLISVSSTNLSSQWYFLRELVQHLTTQATPYDLIACQADLQRDGVSCLLYTYALSSIVAKLSFNTLKQARVSQPVFFDVSHFAGDTLLTVENCSWFSSRALGDKAQLISQSFTHCKKELTAMHSVSEAQQLFNDFKIKYNLVESDDLTHKRTYIDYLRTRFANFPKNFSVEKLKTKFRVQSSGQMMRRAVDSASVIEFDFLIATFAKLDIQNNPLNEPDNNPNKALTPLLYALKRATPGRAIKLLQTEKIVLEKKDACGKNAQDYFSELPDDSVLAKNPILKRYLSRQ